MKNKISRRYFLKKSAVALGTAAVLDFQSVVIPDRASGSELVLSKEFKEMEMPHIIVKLYPGRSEDQKIRLAEAIVKDVVAIARCDEKSVSVAIEEIRPEDWEEKVYKPDILGKLDKLYKKPGYNP